MVHTQVKVMHKQLLLFHNAIASYFSGNQSALDETLKQFNIKLKTPNSERPSWLETRQWLSVSVGKCQRYVSTLARACKFHSVDCEVSESMTMHCGHRCNLVWCVADDSIMLVRKIKWQFHLNRNLLRSLIRYGNATIQFSCQQLGFGSVYDGRQFSLDRNNFEY